jgi:hypothetical protein
MFKIAQLATKTTLSKVAPVSKSFFSKLAPAGKMVGNATLSTAIRLPLSLAKMSLTLLPMIGSAVFGGIYLLIKFMK